MATVYDYLDTSQTGKPVTASGQVLNLGAEVPFYISVASNLIAGQSSGPSVQFTIYSQKGESKFNVDYGTVNANWQALQSGYRIEATVPAGASVSCRVVVRSIPTPITVVTVGTVTTGGEQSGGSGVGIGTGPTLLYTAPPGFKAILLRAMIAAGSANRTVSLWVEGTSVSSPPFDYILSGITVLSTSDYFIGFGPGNSTVLTGPIVLMPGDEMYAESSGTDNEIEFEFLLVPL